MISIFINYRREDCEGYAGRIYDRLKQNFNESSIFFDGREGSIGLGENFVTKMIEKVKECTVLLALIGPGWLNAKKNGLRRLDNPNDYVRCEIKTALEEKKIVIPVLLQGEKMPLAESLHSDIRELVKKNAIEMSLQRFDFDSEVLVEKLKPEVLKIADVNTLGDLTNKNIVAISKIQSHYEMLCKHSPERADYHLALGLCYLNSRNYVLAKDSLTLANKLEPSNDKTLYYLALSFIGGNRLRLLKLADAKSANGYLRKAIELNKNQTHYIYLLAALQVGFFISNGMKVIQPVSKDLIIKLSNETNENEEKGQMLSHLNISEQELKDMLS